MEKTITVKGMHCKSCEKLISNALLEVKGINKVKVDYATEKAVVNFDDTAVDVKGILATIEDTGYEPSVNDESGNGTKKKFLGLF